MSIFLKCKCFVFYRSTDDDRLYDTDDSLAVTWNIRQQFLNLSGKIVLGSHLCPIKEAIISSNAFLARTKRTFIKPVFICISY